MTLVAPALGGLPDPLRHISSADQEESMKTACTQRPVVPAVVSRMTSVSSVHLSVTHGRFVDATSNLHLISVSCAFMFNSRVFWPVYSKNISASKEKCDELKSVKFPTVKKYVLFFLCCFVTGDLEALKKQAFVLKEGVEYKIKISFKVFSKKQPLNIKIV